MARKILFLLFAFSIVIFLFGCAKTQDTGEIPQEMQSAEVNDMTQKNIDGVNIEWLGQSGFVFRNEKVIYIDPFKVSSTDKADIILITHEHYDHCSIEDIKRIIKPETIIVTVPDCQSKLSGMKVANITLVRPGNKVNVKGTIIEAVPAYNLNKKFHPKENEWVGFVVTINGKRIYHAGDTDTIPEMKSLSNIDIAMVPIGGTYTMTAEEAANAVNQFRPKTAIPMHYGTIIGSKSDGEKFKSLAKVNVEILG